MIPLGSLRLADKEAVPLERIAGFETEYALGWKNAQGGYDSNIAHRLAVIAVGNSDWQGFRKNGARMYLDVGDHPEYSTAERNNFLESANELLHGHVAMAGRLRLATRRNRQRLGHGKPELICNTADAHGNSWGCHENYLAPRLLELKQYIPALLIHNASRIVWSGAGAVRYKDDGSYSFGLSEKAPYIWEGVSIDTTRSRPLVNTRDEPLADAERYRRIHNVSGETVFSPTANALRLASASIILRACEAGADFAELELVNPVEAMRAISNDPSLKTEVELKKGGCMTGVQLQLAVAEKAWSAIEKIDYYTPQEEVWFANWITVLDDLAIDPKRCVRRLDWIIKQAYIKRALEAERESTDTDMDVALKAAADFHALLPAEGGGMQLIRKGLFDLSPSHKVLDHGLPLPETRAKVRGQAIARALRERREFSSTWDAFTVHGYMGIQLREPYAASDTRIDSYQGFAA